MSRDPAAAVRVDLGPDLLPGAKLAGLHEHVVSAGVTPGDRLGIAHRRAPSRPLETPGVAHLAASLRVERRHVEQDGTALPGCEDVDLTIDADANDGGVGFQQVVAHEAGRGKRGGAGEADAARRRLTTLTLL